MKMLRRFLAPLLALCFALTSAPVGALPPARTAVVLSGVQGWSFPGSSIDLFFSRNGGSCAVSRILKPCASLLTTTRASTGYAQWSDNHWSLYSSNIPRISDLGLLVEQAATNIALWDRDLTNANWTKSSTTAALDQVGIDNGASSASSLTATGANGTACAAAITSASASRTVSAFVKRITGTGAVSISQDGGATYTAITTKVGAAWYRPTPTDFAGMTQTVTNPQICVKIATSGDKIAVDFVDLEAGAFDTSPIATTTVAVTRAADVINLAGAALTAALSAKSALTVTNLMSGSTTPRAVDFNGVQQLRWSATNTVDTDNGVNTGAQATIGGAGTYAGLVKYASGFDANGYTAKANGGTLTADTTHAWGSMSGPVTLGNGPSGDRTHPINGYMLRVVFGSIKGQFDGATQ